MPPKDFDHEDFASNDHSDYVFGDTHYPLCEDIPYTDGKSMIMIQALWRWMGIISIFLKMSSSLSDKLASI